MGRVQLALCFSAGETTKAPGKGRSSHRTRNKRGRNRASKDTSKLLLLYDEDILERDPLREQKDLAFAQAYLSRVSARGWETGNIGCCEASSAQRGLTGSE